MILAGFEPCLIESAFYVIVLVPSYDCVSISSSTLARDLFLMFDRNDCILYQSPTYEIKKA